MFSFGMRKIQGGLWREILRETFPSGKLPDPSQLLYDDYLMRSSARFAVIEEKYLRAVK